MQILLANAKIMFGKVEKSPWSMPMFQETANGIAVDMAAMDVFTLQKELDCSHKLAVENWKRFQMFFTAEKMPALLSYNGQAYKHLRAATLDDDALMFAQNHLWITCFLYGLLRPMDGIVPYRMEHCVHLPSAGGTAVNRYWHSLLTDVLIESVKADDGVLLHLSTEEYEHLFDWQKVKQEVKVVHPLFYVRQNDGSLKMQAVWAKACRGAMTRHVLEHKVTSPSALHDFRYDGFAFAPCNKFGVDILVAGNKDCNEMVFVREAVCRMK